MKILRWLSKDSYYYIWKIALLGLLQGFLALCGILFAFSMREVIDFAVIKDADNFYRGMIILILLIVTQLLLSILNRYFKEDVRASLENFLRLKIFDSILKTDFQNFVEYHSGELMNRITSDVSIVANGVVNLYPSIISMSIKIIGGLIAIYMMKPQFMWILLLGGCLLVLGSFYPRKWVQKMHRYVQEEDGHVRCFLQECFESLIVIRAFGCEKKMIDLSKFKMSNYKKACIRRGMVSNICQSTLAIFFQLEYIIGFYLCGTGILNGELTYGTMAAVIQLISQIQSTFANVGTIYIRYYSMLASLERIDEILIDSSVLKNEIIQSKEKVYDIYAKMKEIKFNNLIFSYDKSIPVFDKLNFNIQKGNLVGIVGHSGRGKSTLMKLLMSVYLPDSGEIIFDLENETLPVSKIGAGMFAYVPQGNYLMSGSIKEIVAFVDDTKCISNSEVEKACQVAHAHEFITSLPQGYETVLGEKGLGLSEGQIQRLAIARAIYSGCPILLLDEATSALDEETEMKLIESLKKLENRTIIFITHRTKVLKFCDSILKI